MHTILKAALVAVAVVAVGIGGLWTRTSHQAAVTGPSPSPTATPAPLRPGMTMPAGDYTVAPFGGTQGAPCGPAALDPCADAAVDDAIRFTFTVPDGWAGAPGGNDIWLAGANNSGPEGAGFLLGRGGWLFSDPCSEGVDADIPVGPTVDDFVDALVAHPMLELTDPVDVTIGGYSGKYLELQGPADRTACQYFMAWPTFYAQGDSNHMPIWVLDADGVRIVIHGSEFPDTPPERSAELRAIVESMRIDAPSPLRSGSLPAGDYTVAPFGGAEWAPCGAPPAECPDAAVDDAIRFTFTVPDGWAGAPLGNDIWLAGANNSGPKGAGLLLGRGGWLFSDPCAEGVDADIEVGPTVDDFVDALVAHPSLELTDPVDVTIGGYAGKYLELQGPADRTACQYFQAWAPTFYAQGDSNHQPTWVLDANGVRIVIHGSEFPDTPPERSAELRAIVESMRIHR